MRTDAHMRTCGCDAEDKICMRIVGKKTRSKIEQNWRAHVWAQKRLKFLTKNSQKSIKNRPKNGPKMVIFLLLMRIRCASGASDAHRCASPKPGARPSLVWTVLTLDTRQCPDTSTTDTPDSAYCANTPASDTIYNNRHQTVSHQLNI